jgi:hypothetical protein
VHLSFSVLELLLRYAANFIKWYVNLYITNKVNKMIKSSELMHNTISCTFGGAVVGNFFGMTGSVIGAVLGAVVGVLNSREPQNKKPVKGTSPKSS